MSVNNLAFGALVEEHAKRVSESDVCSEKTESYNVSLKVLLADLCYLFFNREQDFAIQRTYIAKFLQNNHHDYIHNTYIIISFLIKLLEAEKAALGFAFEESKVRFIKIVSDVIRTHIDIATKDYYLDELTGLFSYNYIAHFEKELQANISEPVVTIVMIDLDGLKRINDTQGHTQGNKIIREFAKALLESTRQGDICIRFGGDEFLVIFAGEKAMDYGRFLTRLENNSRILHHQISYSSGMAKGTISRMSLQEIIDLADQRMYQQKQGKKNTALD